MSQCFGTAVGPQNITNLCKHLILDRKFTWTLMSKSLHRYGKLFETQCTHAYILHTECKRECTIQSQKWISGKCLSSCNFTKGYIPVAVCVYWGPFALCLMSWNLWHQSNILGIRKGTGHKNSWKSKLPSMNKTHVNIFLRLVCLHDAIANIKSFNHFPSSSCMTKPAVTAFEQHRRSSSELVWGHTCAVHRKANMICLCCAWNGM